MKGLIIMSGIIGGIILGFYPSLEKERPLWWKLITVFSVTALIFLALYPPLGGTFIDAVLASRMENSPYAQVKVKFIPGTESFDQEKNRWAVQMQDMQNHPRMATVFFDGKIFPEEIKSGKPVILKVKREMNDAQYKAIKIVSVDPALTIPFVPALSERTRNLYFHVPMSWVAVLAYLISMVYSIQYLRKKEILFDIKSSSAAALGTLFTILATVTGAVWAKFNWGAFWNWDPRQTSIFVLLLIYGAYFALRAAIENEEQRARLSSVYSIIAFVTVPFFIFILPRITEGLHPGSADSGNAGPVLSSNPDALNPVLQIIFSLAMMSFTLVYFWMLSIQIRTKKLELRPSYRAE